MTPDIINGIFEALGFAFILPSIWKLSVEKEVRGVSWLHASFFWVWSLWNLHYYPALGQWCSFAGAIMLFVTNTIWVAQLLYYNWRTK